MKTRLWIMLGLAAILSLSSCNDEENIFSSSGLVNAISISGQDFIDGDAVNGTRAAYTVDDSGFRFSWSQGDTVGIYPVGGDQVAFPISSGEGSKSAQFDGGAWALRSTYSYAAYYPYSVMNCLVSENSIPVNYLGQYQNGNGSLDCLDRYDYQASVATRPDSDGNVNISLKHLGCFVRFQLTMPVADTFKSITLQSNKTPFVISGTYDLTQEEIAIVPTETSASFAVKLDNAMTTDEDKVLTIYAMLAPSDLSDSDIAINIEGTTYRSYTATVIGKNMQAGKAYSYSATVKTGTNINGEDVAWDDNGQVIADVNGHEYVDLGLSVLWATCNVGADKPEGYGDYYAWGDIETYYESGYAQSTEPVWKDGKSAGYDWPTYKYSYGSNTKITKYCNKNSCGNDGFTDNNYTLLPEDDVAHLKWGSEWRMPTQAEFDELIHNCNWRWTTQNGVNGWKVSNSQDSSRYIFLPSAGYRSDTRLRYIDSRGYYWSSSLYTGNPGSAWGLDLKSDDCFMSYDDGRCYGFSIRPVMPKPVEHEYVDLGLSVKWATCNIGAENPEDYGDYFAWGETEPKSVYSWATYLDNPSGDGSTFIKYKYGGKTQLDPEDDAANVIWGNGWRMPTYTEQEELANSCNWTVITINEKKVFKITGPNGNYIYLPKSGFKNSSGDQYIGSMAYYWSSTLSSTTNAYHFWDGPVFYNNFRRDGMPIRPVRLPE